MAAWVPCEDCGQCSIRVDPASRSGSVTRRIVTNGVDGRTRAATPPATRARGASLVQAHG
jgi:hypothetical protein